MAKGCSAPDRSHGVSRASASRLSVEVAHAVEPMDADAWVAAYIRLLMRLEGARASADAIREAS